MRNDGGFALQHEHEIVARSGRGRIIVTVILVARIFDCGAKRQVVNTFRVVHKLLAVELVSFIIVYALEENLSTTYSRSIQIYYRGRILKLGNGKGFSNNNGRDISVKGSV